MSYHCPEIDEALMLETLRSVVSVPSPTGFTEAAAALVSEIAGSLGFEAETESNGNVVVTVPGREDGPCTAVAAHIDTLGLMVRSVNADGTLNFSGIGGNIFPTLDGEYCTIHASSGGEYTGTILSKSPSLHVYADARSAERTESTMMIRVDEPVSCREDTEALGIETGDFISVEPKFCVTSSGYVKSRYLDDKSGVSILLTVLRTLSKESAVPPRTVRFIFSAHEEVGYGCAYLPGDTSVMIGVDMGCVGDDLACTERDVSLCVKDSSGPYNTRLVRELAAIARENGISCKKDVYPNYASDISAALRGGNNIAGALIGPGVSASHGMERTHLDALKAAVQLIYLYIMREKQEG